MRVGSWRREDVEGWIEDRTRMEDVCVVCGVWVWECEWKSSQSQVKLLGLQQHLHL